MPRRQTRIQAHSIPGKINDLIGKSANIVLRDKSVFFVQIIDIDGSMLNAINFRNRKVSLELEQIDEIILDY